jgi:hypothetical protein
MKPAASAANEGYDPPSGAGCGRDHDCPEPKRNTPHYDQRLRPGSRVFRDYTGFSMLPIHLEQNRGQDGPAISRAQAELRHVIGIAFLGGKQER